MTKEIFLYNELLDDIKHEVKRSNEDFIKHYYFKYGNPDLPPAWMTLEVISMGTLSRLFELLKKDDNKGKIASMYGLNAIDIMENWIHALSNLRNCCAHHSRIWNRRFIVNLKLPKNATNLFLDRETMQSTRRNKLFAYLCCIKYILDIISPGNSFKKNLNSLIDEGGKLLSLKERKTNPLSEDALNQQHSRASRLAVQLIKAGVNKIISERDAMETLALLNGLKLTDDIAKNILSAIKTYSETLDSHVLVETLDKIKD